MFDNKRAGRWLAIQICKLYCYVGIFICTLSMKETLEPYFQEKYKQKN
jgi:hypothetical protein